MDNKREDNPSPTMVLYQFRVGKALRLPFLHVSNGI